MENKFISIIVPAHNSVRTMKRCVESLLSLDYPSFEIIVVDDGSTDGTPAVLEMFREKKGFRAIRTQQGGPSKARNIAIKEALGEFLAFTDSDCIAEKNWLTELMKGFIEPRSDFDALTIMGVGGDQQNPADDTSFGKDVGGFLKRVGFVADYVKDAGDLSVMTETGHNPTCNVLYRKEVFDKIGYFKEDLWPGEDVELDYRIKKAGYRLLFNPAAVVRHYRPGDMRSFGRMMYRYGKVQALLVKQHGFFRKLHFEPFGFLLMALVYLLTALKSAPALLLLFLLQFSVFLFYFLEKSRDLWLSVKYVWLLIITVAGWNAGFVMGALEKK
jgi:glycosyltransferase involved in cell wall biosynthesis